MTSVRENREVLSQMFPQLDLAVFIQNNLNKDLQQMVTYILENEQSLPKLEQPQRKKARLSEGCLDTTLEFKNPNTVEKQKVSVVRKETLDDALSLLVNYFNEEIVGTVAPVRCTNYGIDVVGFMANEFSWMRINSLRALYKASPNLMGLLISCFFINNSLSGLSCFTSILNYYRTHCCRLDLANRLLNIQRKRSSFDVSEPPEISMAIKQFEKKLVEIAASSPKCFEELLWRRGHVKDLLPEERAVVFECLVCDNEFPLENAFSCEYIDLPTGHFTNRAAQPSASKAVQDIQEHMFCIDCIRGQAKASVAEAFLDSQLRGVKCMASGCSNPILYEKIRAYLPRSVRLLLEQRIADQNVCSAVKNLERCTKCGFSVEMDVPRKINKVFKCLACNYQYCRYCQLDWEKHFGLNCKEAEVGSVDAFRKQTEIKLNEAIIRKCPKCQLAFVKESQCNKMTCRCGLTMCYICRKVNIDYSHFCNHPRDPKVKKCIHCKTKVCMLWEDYRQYDEKAMKKVLEERTNMGPGNNG